MNILAFGEINFDLILRDAKQVVVAPGRETLVDDFIMTLGSSTATTAAGLIRLGNQAAFVGWVGNDASGDFCLNSMNALGLDVSRIRRHPSMKTSVTVSLSSPEDRSLVSYLGTIPELRREHIEDRFFTGFHHVHSSSYFLQTGMHEGFRDVFSRARRHGLTTSLDPACDPQLRWESRLRETLAEVDVFLPNETELYGITGEAEPERGLRCIEGLVKRTVVKLGAKGAMTLEGGRAVCVSAPPVDVVDPTGAGDNFNSGFLHAWLHRKPILEALQLGVACGSFSVRAVGGTTAQATLPEALALVNQGKDAR